MKRAILLQMDPTTSKAAALNRFSQEALLLANILFKARTSKRLMALHTRTYQTSKRKTGFNSQVVCDIERSVTKCKGTRLKAVTVKFNVPRNCKTFTTRSRLFVEFGPYPHRRIAVPIWENENLRRYRSLIEAGWTCKTYGLTSDQQVVAYLQKKDTAAASPGRENVLGVDVNSKCFAVTILTPNGKVLLQTYMGKDIWVKRKHMMIHRARLQSLADRGSHRAQRSINHLKTRERDLVRNRVGEVVRDITRLAIEHDTNIAIEGLKRFSPKSRKFNREVLRMPFYQFRRTLESRCFDKSIVLTTVDPYHTSKWCSRCGAVAARGHSANYALFKCPKCGLIVNSDRKASLAVAVKSLLARNPSPNQRWFQVAGRRVPVSGLLHSDEEAARCSAPQAATADGKPTTFSRG
jgi:IS605 OrfB family transposase